MQGCEASAPAAGKQEPLPVHLFAMPAYHRVSGNKMLQSMHIGQLQHPIKEVWHPKRRLPVKLVDYMCAATGDLPAEIRQGGILLLKRYLLDSSATSSRGGGQLRVNLQVAALTCVQLAMKYWHQHGITQQKLHWLSKNAFTQQEFVDAEVDIMQVLHANVHWEGSLLCEWVSLLLLLGQPLFSRASDHAMVSSVATHISDMLMFEDELMTKHLPSDLAAAVVHAAVTLCTKRFQRQALTLWVGHLSQTSEEQVVQLSEAILAVSVGTRCADALLEGIGFSSEESEVDEGARKRQRGRTLQWNTTSSWPNQAEATGRKHGLAGNRDATNSLGSDSEG